jgi:hypothetical protein
MHIVIAVGIIITRHGKELENVHTSRSCLPALALLLLLLFGEMLKSGRARVCQR